jgi:hypothetical protein
MAAHTGSIPILASNTSSFAAVVGKLIRILANAGIFLVNGIELCNLYS